MFSEADNWRFDTFAKVLFRISRFRLFHLVGFRKRACLPVYIYISIYMLYPPYSLSVLKHYFSFSRKTFYVSISFTFLVNFCTRVREMWRVNDIEISAKMASLYDLKKNMSFIRMYIWHVTEEKTQNKLCVITSIDDFLSERYFKWNFFT